MMTRTKHVTIVCAAALLVLDACDSDGPEEAATTHTGDIGGSEESGGDELPEVSGGAVLDVTLGSRHLFVDSGIQCVSVPGGGFVYGGSGTSDDGESFTMGGTFGSGAEDDNTLSIDLGGTEYWTVDEKPGEEPRGEFLERSVDDDARTATGRAIMVEQWGDTEMATFEIRC